jgi:aryl-alcohol dehydrogenase-like predicted oxidoreductase
MVWSPLAGGQYDPANSAEGRRPAFDFPPVDRKRADAVIDAMRPIAEAKERSVAQVVLARVVHQRQG